MLPVLQKINFTRSESRVIIFSVVLILSGLLITYIRNAGAGNGAGIFMPEQIKGNIQYFPGKDNSGMRTTAGPYEEKISVNEKARDSIESKSRKKSKKEDKLNGVQINLNTASKEQLMMLPGVGDSTADKIIEYRKDHYGFKKIEEIMKIKGIGKKKFEKLKPYITVD